MNYVVDRLNEEWIEEMIDEFDENMISKKRKILLKRYIKEKVNILRKIFNGEEEECL